MNEPIYLPLARSAIDRDYLTRKADDLFAHLQKDKAAKVLPIFNGKVLLVGEPNDESPQLRLFDTDEISQDCWLAYLGRAIDDQEIAAGSAVILAVLNKQQADAIEPNEQSWHVLRRTGAGLSDFGAGLYAQGLALANWHSTHKHCPNCGSETVSTQSGWARACQKDLNELYPRTDPAIIVSVIDQQDRILLGSQGICEENRWSVLAGFVEPGESLTAAVIREMHEESGMHVVDPIYLGSQSWPFPYSLMVGFTAKIDPKHPEKDLVPDGEEIEKLRWFSREDLEREAKDLLLPGRLTIARALIEHWYGQKIISASELS
jgi:NAD+ diphosphatase